MLQRTRLGTAMRAVSDSRDLAEASGIDVRRVILATWMLGAALAALGGLLIGLSETVVWNMGFTLLLLMFAAVVLGGIGTAYGAMVGGIVLGVASQVSTYWIEPKFRIGGEPRHPHRRRAHPAAGHPRSSGAGRLSGGLDRHPRRLVAHRARTDGGRLRAGRHRAQPALRLHGPAQLRARRLPDDRGLRSGHHRRPGRAPVARDPRRRRRRGGPRPDLRSADASPPRRVPRDRHHRGGRGAARAAALRRRGLADPRRVRHPGLRRRLLRRQPVLPRQLRLGSVRLQRALAVGHGRGVVAGRAGDAARQRPGAQPVGPGAARHPRGRGRRPVAREERLPLQAAEPRARRRDRRPRRDRCWRSTGSPSSPTPSCRSSPSSSSRS